MRLWPLFQGLARWSSYEREAGLALISGSLAAAALVSLAPVFWRGKAWQAPIAFVLLWLPGFALSAAEPSKPATFEIRSVLDAASSDSEELTCTHPGTAPGKKVDEKLQVQKKTLLDRSAIKSAAVQRSAVSGAPEIAITFTERGSKRFAEVTRDHVGHRLAIVIDGKVYSAPKIMMEISGGKAVISGSFTEEEATQLAARLSAGATK